MPICSNQHESHTPDFCEVCGVEIPAAAGSGSVPLAPTSGAGEICPACHAEHDAAVGIFCEVCGYNFQTGAGPAPAPAPPPVTKLAEGAGAATGETMVSGAHRERLAPAAGPAPLNTDPALPPMLELVITVATTPHDGMPDAQPLPVLVPRVQSLDGHAFLIGRRSIRRNISPEIALDPDDGVSHRHAQLTRTADGAFSLSDLGSSNGTTLNGKEILPGVAVTLKEGDIIALGRWTCLTLRRAGHGAEPTLLSSNDSPLSP